MQILVDLEGGSILCGHKGYHKGSLGDTTFLFLDFGDSYINSYKSRTINRW